MTSKHPNRRSFMYAAASGLAGLSFTRNPANAAAPADEAFRYEISRTAEEWRQRLTKDEFNILRKGGTEWPKSSALWNNTAQGSYHCRGCSLSVYISNWKVELDKGWAFFKHAIPDSVLMDIDGQPAYGAMSAAFGPMIEVHCRRCASHLGHILKVDGKVLHCINGTALTFRPRQA